MAQRDRLALGGRRACVVSTLYLGWSVAAQTYVKGIAEASLRADGRKVERLLVTPTALNTLLWRVVAITPDGYLEGFRSVFDRDSQDDIRCLLRAAMRSTMR